MKHCLGCGEKRHAGLCKPTARNAAQRQPVTRDDLPQPVTPERFLADLAIDFPEAVAAAVARVKARGHAQPKTGMTPAERQRAYRARKKLA